MLRIGTQLVSKWLSHMFAAGTMRKTTHSFLTDFTLAAVRTASFIPAFLGRACTTGKPRSGITRVYRFYSNEALNEDLLNDLYAQAFRAQTQGARNLLLQLDWTTLRQHLQCLCLSRLEYDPKRAIPCFWSAYDENHDKELQAHDAHEHRLLQLLAPNLPEGCEVTVLSDRGFDAPKTLMRLEELKLHYLIRMAQGDCLRLPGGDWIKVTNELLKPGCVHDFGMIEYTREHAHRVRLVALWEHGQKEPWFLLTNHQTLGVKQLGDLYARRMSIEALFKSMKNELHGLDLKAIRIKKIERWRPYLWVASVVMQFLGELGTLLQEVPGIEQWFSLCSKPPKKQKWIFSIYELARKVLMEDRLPLRWSGRILKVRLPGEPFLALE